MLKVVFLDFTRTITNENGMGSGPYLKGRNAAFDALEDAYAERKMTPREFIEKSMKLWEGVTKADVQTLSKKFGFIDGLPEFIASLKEKGVKCVLISKNSDLFGNAIQERLGLDYAYGTKCEIVNDTITGNVVEMPKSKGESVKDYQQKHNLTPAECAAIGDEPSDIPMFEEVSLSITYKGDPEVQEIVDYSIEDYHELLSLLEKDGHI